MKLEDWTKRVGELIELADKTLASGKPTSQYEVSISVDRQLFTQFRSSSLSFLRNCFSEDHPYFEEFKERTDSQAPWPKYVQSGRGVLVAVQDEMKGGWSATTKGLVSAEIFTDFLDMA